jgi:hypothetical protein
MRNILIKVGGFENARKKLYQQGCENIGIFESPCDGFRFRSDRQIGIFLKSIKERGPLVSKVLSLTTLFH